MATYKVTETASGMDVYRYQANEPVPWEGMGFGTHTHTEIVISPTETPAPGKAPRTLTKLEYLRRFTAEERITIRTVAKSNPTLEDYLALMELAEEVNIGDADTVAAVQLLEQAGLIGVGRAEEILNGN